MLNSPRVLRGATILSATVFGLAGCGGGEAQSAAPTAPSASTSAMPSSAPPSSASSTPSASPSAVVDGSRQGVYRASIDGADVVVTVPITDDNAVVTKVEKYRRAVKGEGPVTYVSVKMSNGSQATKYLCPLKAVTGDGGTLTFQTAMSYVGDLSESVVDDTKAYNDGVDLYNSLLNSDETLPGATSTTVFVVAQSLPVLKSVFGGAVASGELGPCDVPFSQG